MVETLTDELERRRILELSIDFIVAANFKSSPEEILRRGAVQTFILLKLGLNRTAFLCNLINERLIAAGYYKCTIKGYGMYKDISFR
jgi:hypothetical protein